MIMKLSKLRDFTLWSISLHFTHQFLGEGRGLLDEGVVYFRVGVYFISYS